MAAGIYDVKFTVSQGANAGVYGFMLVSPPGEPKQWQASEVQGPQVERTQNDAIFASQDFNPLYDTPFAQASWVRGCGQLEFDGGDEAAYWWGENIVTHVDGKVFLAPLPSATPLSLSSSVEPPVNFRSYVTSAGVQYDFTWVAHRLYRRPQADATTAWTLVWSQPNSLPITDVIVFNSAMYIAVPTLTNAIGGDYYRQADPTAAATWSPTLIDTTTNFSNTNGRPKYWVAVRSTLFALVDNSKVYYSVDPSTSTDCFSGPIVTTVASLSSPGVGELTYPFTGGVSVNDYLLALRWDSGLNIDDQQTVREIFWQWKDKPSTDNFKYITAAGENFVFAIGPEVYLYDPGTGAMPKLRLAQQSGFSCQEVLGLAADNQYIYIMAMVRVPTIRSTSTVVILRAYKLPGGRWAFEPIWEDTNVGTKQYRTLGAVGNGIGTRLYWGYQPTSGGATSTYVMDIPADWDETGAGGNIAATGYLYTSITRANFPGFSKRQLYFNMETQNVTHGTNPKIEVDYSTDNGASFTALGSTDTGADQRTTLTYDDVEGRAIVLRFKLTRNGSVSPVLRVFDNHQRVRFRYLPSITCGIRVADHIELLNGTRDNRKLETVAAQLQMLRTEDNEILYEDFMGNSFNVSFDQLVYRPTRHHVPESKHEREATIVINRADAGS